MRVLVINAGSSSVKFSVFDQEAILIKGTIKGIGQDHGATHYEFKGKEHHTDAKLNDHKAAFHHLIDILLGCDVHEVQAVGHRVVHGGNIFIKPVRISSAMLSRIELLDNLAPLHNPVNVLGIKEAMKLFDHVPHVAVFDTSFHATIPEHIHIIDIPEEFKHDGLIRNYGFHGMSHEFVYKRSCEIVGKQIKKAICAHIGNGISVTAIEDGKSINNSMKFTPMTGTVMGTRTGDIDFGVAHYLNKHDGLDFDEIDSLFNHQGGLYAITGHADIQYIKENKGEMHDVALKKLISDLARRMAAYTADLQGVDAFIFTGGAGEAAPWLRDEVLKKLAHLSVNIDSAANEKNQEGIISTKDSSVKALMIHTNEELMIAQKASEVVSKSI